MLLVAYSSKLVNPHVTKIQKNLSSLHFSQHFPQVVDLLQVNVGVVLGLLQDLDFDNITGQSEIHITTELLFTGNNFHTIFHDELGIFPLHPVQFLLHFIVGRTAAQFGELFERNGSVHLQITSDNWDPLLLAALVDEFHQFVLEHLVVDPVLGYSDTRNNGHEFRTRISKHLGNQTLEGGGVVLLFLFLLGTCIGICVILEIDFLAEIQDLNIFRII